MPVGYFFFYAEANIFCIAIFLLLLINDRIHSTQQEKQLWFNRTLIAHILYFASDIGWAGVLGGQLVRSRATVLLFNFLNFVLLGMIAYCWFMYMAASENMPLVKNRKKRLWCRIPLILSIVLLVVLYVINPALLVTESDELTGLYYPLMLTVPILYILVSFVFSMINAGKEKRRESRRLYRLIGIYPMVVMLFGLLQTIFLDAPLFCFGCTVMMLYFYIRNLETMVSADSLTRLNNRGQIDRYMEQVQYRENVNTYAMMLDIDHFKEINDSFGHAEGDRALILVAETLRQAAERREMPMFIGRYGGDEYTLFVQSTEGPEVMDRLAEEIERILEEKQKEDGLPYALKVSFGYDVLRDGNDRLEDCLKRADTKLYENKRRKGAGR